MAKLNLLQHIARKDSDKAKISVEILSNPDEIPAVIEGLNNPNPRVRFGCSKVLRLASEKKPEVLYPRMESFAGLLNNSNTFLRLDASRVLANLAAIDSECKFENIFDEYFAPIAGPAMIPAAVAIGSAALIVKAKPRLTGKIVVEMLKVEHAKYATRECRNVALGHAIRSLDTIFDQIEDKAPVVNLIKRQLRNSRPATRKKAEAFVKKHGI